LVKKTLVPRRDLDVLDCSAFNTDNVVVMTSQPIGDLIPGDSSASMVGSNHSGVFQDSKCAIQRRQGEVGQHTVELGRRLRALTGHEGIDDGAPSPRVSDVAFAES
jgi:hypothetical protein